MSTAIPLVDQEARQKWNERYQQHTGTPQPAQVLWENQHLLPATGTALDLACGLGGNALLLAERGLETWAWDIADVAVQRLQSLAQQHQLPLHVELRDVIATPPAPESFDVIVVSRFLDRALITPLLNALRPDGLLLYQTFTTTTLAVEDIGPKNPAYRLAVQELLILFHPLRVVMYREEGRLGDVSRGVRNEALFIGHKGSRHVTCHGAQK